MQFSRGIHRARAQALNQISKRTRLVLYAAAQPYLLVSSFGQLRECSTSSASAATSSGHDSSLRALLAVHNITNGFRRDLRTADDFAFVEALVKSSGWSALGLLDCAVALRRATARGATLLHTQPFTQELLQHATRQLHVLLQSPLKSWGGACLSPAELAAIVRAGVQCPPSPAALGTTVAALVGCATALNRLPSLPLPVLEVYALLDACGHRLLAPSSRSEQAVQAWRRNIVCSDEVFPHITVLVHALVASGAWSYRLIEAYAACLVQRAQACPPGTSAAHVTPALAQGAKALCAARAVTCLTTSQWKELAGLFLDEEEGLQGGEGGVAHFTPQDAGEKPSWFGQAAQQAQSADVWGVEEDAFTRPSSTLPLVPADLLQGIEVQGPLAAALLQRAAPLPDLGLVLTGKASSDTPGAAPVTTLYTRQPAGGMTPPSVDNKGGGVAAWVHDASAVLQLLLAKGVLPRPKQGSVTAMQLQRMAHACETALAPLVSSSQCDQLREALHRARLPQPRCGVLASGTATSDGDATAPPAKQAMSASTAIRRLQAAVMPRGAALRRSTAQAEQQEERPPLGMHGVPVMAGWARPRPAVLLGMHSSSTAQRRAPLAADLVWIAPQSPLHEETHRVATHEAAASSTVQLAQRLAQRHASQGLRLTAGAASWGVPLVALAGSAGSQLGRRPAKRRLAAAREAHMALNSPLDLLPQSCVSMGMVSPTAQAASHPRAASALGMPPARRDVSSDVALASLPSSAAGQLQELVACLPPAMAASVASSGLEAAEVAFLAARARLANTGTRLQMDTLAAAGVTPLLLPLHEWRSISAARRAAYLRMLLP